jgi:hypothetical protein
MIRGMKTNEKYIETLIEKVMPENSQLHDLILKDSGEQVLKMIEDNIDLSRSKNILYYSTSIKPDDNQNFNDVKAIVDLNPLNKKNDINSHFSAINKLLPDAAIYIGCLESYYNRKTKIYKTFPKVIAYMIWAIDFVFNRVVPKWKPTKGLYHFITNNMFNAVSLAEALGRLVYCGFEVIGYKYIDNLTYFIVLKTNEPRKTGNPSFGPFFKMNRVGKDGKLIGVYKLRTMHPYSEFLQDYVVKMYGYNEVGKPSYDFRVAGWGKVFRKLWLDEVPQFFNVLKGELGLVGVRPLSTFRYNQLPEDIRMERIKYKPGCIPPYVALNMPDSLGNIEAERIYLKDKAKRPYYTNFRYLAMAVYNILTNKIRSA